MSNKIIVNEDILQTFINNSQTIFILIQDDKENNDSKKEYLESYKNLLIDILSNLNNPQEEF